MKLFDPVSPAAVLTDLRGETKDEALRELSEAAARLVPTVSADDVMAILQDRERLGSTGIGEGAAIPHGKVAGLDRLVTVFARSKAGVQFQSLDGKPTHLFFLVLAPEHSAGLHLKALARISRLLKDARFRASLSEAPDAVALIELLSEADEHE
ncbi:MAG TPA: PTS sugar transporter subunit IIA [Candidatus Deferrimicrobiaceae bacterium]|jgi:PTS system nitrogen regulatory IIA component